MIPTYLIVGNILSFCCALCIGISVLKKDKETLIWWQIWNAVFALLASFVLASYASFTTNILCFIRNILAYNKGLTRNLTLFLSLLCLVIGLYANNRGIFGLLPIVAFILYTALMYLAKNDQQMRYAIILCLSLWFAHDLYIQAYPSAFMDIALSLWSFYQAMRRIKRAHRMKKTTKFSYLTG